MDLECVMQSEITQAQKEIKHVFLYAEFSQ